MAYLDDEQSRKAIVENLNTNYFVEASAGSGKTTSLVYRMVALVEHEIPVDKICTITFTKAAADEFFARFQKLLSERSVLADSESDDVLGKKSPKSVKLCQNALANIDLCFLGTIDSFLNMIAHEMPVEIGIPSGSEIISKDERNSLLKAEYEKLLRDSNHPLHNYTLIFKDLFYPAYDCFAKGVELLSSCRNMEIVYDRSLLNITESYFYPEKDKLLEIAKTIIDCKAYYVNDTNDERRDARKNVEIFYNIMKNKNFVDDISGAITLLKSIQKSAGFPDEVRGSKLETELIVEKKSNNKNHLFQYTEDAKEIIEKMVVKFNDYKHSLYLHVVSNALGAINQKLKEDGKLDFNDFLFYITQAFEKNARGDRELIEHIYERHSYFLIDESQDTNPMQTELFFYLTSEKGKHWNEWVEIEPRAGSLFIVGDPKQSIYGFRGANVEAYMRNKKIFEDKDQVLLLTRNFRSNVALKKWFNLTMDKILNRAPEALSHIDIPISKEEEDTYQEPFIDGKIDKGTDNVYDGEYRYIIDVSKEPDAIAQLIYKWVNDKHNKIIVKKPKRKDGKKEEKPWIYSEISYSDFLIVPRGTDVSKYVAAFKQYNIPVMIEAMIPFNDSSSLLTLVDLIELLKQPANRNAFIKVLCGSLYKLEHLDIVYLLNNGFKFDLSDVGYLFDVDNPSSIDTKYLDIIEELNDLYQKTRNMSFSSTMLYILNNKDFSLLNRVNSENLEYAYFLIEKIKEKEEAGELSGIGQLMDFFTNFLNDNKDDNRVLRFKDKIDRVKISNLHKVKGLEAPIVILIKPREYRKKAKSYIDYSSIPPKANFASISDPENKYDMFESSMYDDVTKSEWDAHARAENDRLEYVGATRARSVLIVAERDDTHKSYYNPWEDIYQNINPENRIDIPSVSSVAAEITNVQYDESHINDECNEVTKVYRSPSTAAKDTKSYPVNNNLDEIKEDDDKKNDATLIGTMVHKLMECLATSRNGFNDDELLVNSIIDEFDGDDYKELLTKVLSKLRNGGFEQKNSSIPQDFLSVLVNAKEVYCETPFSYKMADGTIMYGIIDLIYVDENGYHIIDYKTNKMDDVSYLENKEYKSQLDDYKAALKEQGIDADAHIYHIDVTL